LVRESFGEFVANSPQFYPTNILTNGIISLHISCLGAVGKVFVHQIALGMNLPIVYVVLP